MEPKQSADLSALFERAPKWVHRRVETVELVDDELVRRLITLDFAIKQRDGPTASVGVPATILGAEVLRMEAWDEGGRPVPLTICDDAPGQPGRLLIAAVDPRAGQRQVLRLSYEEPLVIPRRTVSTRFGVSPTRLAFDVPASRHAKTSHLHLEVPDGLEIVQMHAEPAPETRRKPLRRRAHTALASKQTATPCHQFVGPTVIAVVRAERHGFLSSALLLSFVTFCLLGLGAVLLPDVVERNQVVAPALLIVPALLTAFLVRPAEHALTELVLKPTLWALTASGVLAVAAVALLVIADNGKGLTRGLWIGLAVVAWFAFLIPLVTWSRASRKRV